MKKLLKSPLTVIAAMSMGAWAGTTQTRWAIQSVAVGEVFLSLMMMCAIPVIISTMVVSIARLLQSHQIERYLGAMFACFLGSLVLSTGFGTTVGTVLARVMNTSDPLFTHLSRIMAAGPPPPQIQSLSGFVLEIIPRNIFRALSEGKVLSILIFFVLFGVALGRSRSDAARTLVMAFDAVNQAIFEIVGWLILILPFGIFFIFARTFSHQGAEAFVSLGKLLGACVLALLTLTIGVVALILRLFPGQGWKKIRAMREALLVAFSTTSAVQAIPLGIRPLEQELGVAKRTAELVFPLSCTFNLIASASFYATITAFTAGIYQISIGPFGYAWISICVVLRGWATIGMPSVAAANTLALLLAPIAIPGEALTTLIIALVPLIAPFLALANVLVNIAITVVVDRWLNRA